MPSEPTGPDHTGLLRAYSGLSTPRVLGRRGGRDTEIPDHLLLVSTLGGLTLFGLSGVVVGPVLAVLFVAIWEMFAEEYADVANDSGQTPSLNTAPDEASAP